MIIDPDKHAIYLRIFYAKQKKSLNFIYLDTHFYSRIFVKEKIHEI